MKVWYRNVVRQRAKPTSASAAVPVSCLSFVMFLLCFVSDTGLF